MTRAHTRLAAPDQPSRVVYYIRVSQVRGRKGKDFHSPDVQLNWMRRKTVGMKEVEVIDCDLDKTGKNFEREGIERVIALAGAGAFDVLCVYKVNRFGRNTLESLKLLEWLASKGIRIVSAKEDVDTSTPSGRKHLTDLLSGAQMQSEEIGDGWADVIEERAHDGLHHGRNLGYIKKDKIHVLDPLTGPTIVEAFKQYADGAPCGDICDLIFVTTGKRLTPQRLKKMLARPVYRGLVELHGEILPGVHESLCDPETWALVSRRLEEDAGVPPRVQSDAWELSRLAVHLEGHPPDRPAPIYQQPDRDHKDGTRRVRRMICGHVKWRVGGGCDGIGSPLAEEVITIVLDEVTRWISRLKTDPATVAAVMARRATATADIGRIKGSIATTRNAMRKLTADYALDRVRNDVYQATMADFLTDVEAMEAQLRRAQHTTDEPDPVVQASAAAEMLDLWPRMSEHQRNQALRTVVRRVVIRRAAVWREPIRQRVKVLFV